MKKAIIGWTQVALGSLVLLGFWLTLVVAEIGATNGQALLLTLGCLATILWGIRNIKRGKKVSS